MQKTANCSQYVMPAPVTVAQPTANKRNVDRRLLMEQDRRPWLPAQMLRIMKLTTIILLVFCVHVSARTASQTITLSGKDIPLRDVFASIKQQTGFLVWGKSEFLEKGRPLSLAVRNMPLENFLQLVVKAQPFTFRITDNTIILSQRPEETGETNAGPLTDMEVLAGITARVLNAENSEPLNGASIKVKNSRQGVVTNADGFFTLSALAPDATLIISSVGFNTLELSLAIVARMRPGLKLLLKGGHAEKNEDGSLLLYMTPAKVVLTEVIINTGVYKRNKESFTGAASAFTGEQLKAVSGSNILQALKSLDPAFVEVQNNLEGGNPNRLPNFEIRGRTSINTLNLNDQFSSDPNQPLFILDGFESTLQAIYDLDINRVATITILKDAASTALYGSKAANGVVVVETKRPVPGELRLSYNGNFSLDMPDLSDYNLMNAAEKLEFERLSGVYAPEGVSAWENQLKYNERLAEVQRGVNTYWLGEPLRVGFSNRHSVQMTGGNNDLMFNGGLQYGNQQGVMKGSSRNSWGANMGVTYRKHKINISNLLSLSGVTGNESPYGSFSAFASVNPYYRKENEDGTLRRELDPVYDRRAINPLYDALLNSRDETKTFNVTNNLQAMLTLSQQWQIQGNLMLSKGSSTAVRFIPPDHSRFVGIATDQQGSYANTRQENSAYSGNLAITYAKVIGKSRITAMARGEVQEQQSATVGFTAVGFPKGTDGSPAFSQGFTPYSRPVSNAYVARSVGTLVSLNYMYDRRFMIDGVYRLDGASVFGSNELFKPFISGGIGWNLHQERFLKDTKWISLLKIRGNMGYTGNQNLGQFSSVSLYNFVSGNNNTFGQGLTLVSLGNPYLDWQRTFQGSYGIDFALLNNRFSGSVEYYRKKTDPLAVGALGTLASSTGVNQNYVINMGRLITKGLNFNLRMSPVYDLKNRIIWTIGVMGNRISSVYGGFSERLEELNKEEQKNKSLSRYYDGYSPDDMWAVVSRGIDPATGQEIFQKTDGSLTFDYDPRDIVKVGNSRPLMEGTINTSFTYKSFSMGAVIRYRLNGYIFNTALHQKVENTGSYSTTIKSNLDRRALYERWREPGDISKFTGIGNTTSTPVSSRFIQKDSHFSGESVNLSWRTSANWIKAAGMQSLIFNFYLHDIFRLESILSERGINYPYARSMSLSVNASF